MRSFLSAFTHSDTSYLPNSIRFGTDKLANTFLFTGDADIISPISFGGKAEFKQRYRGSVIRSGIPAIRDDQGAQLLYSLPINGSFYALTQCLWYTTEDSRNIGLQSAKRSGIYAGLGFKEENIFNGELAFGYEANEQLGVKAGGASVYALTTLHPLQVSEDLSWKGIGTFNFTQIDSLRNIADIDILLTAFNAGNAHTKSRLLMEVYSKLLNRDFYSPIAGSLYSLGVERRLEKRIALNTEIGFEILPDLQAEILLTIEDADIERLYRHSIQDVPTTSVNRNLQELTINATGILTYYNDNSGFYKAGISVFSRDEKNSIIPVFTIQSSDEEALRRQEYLRDNTSNRLRLFSQIRQPIGNHDTLSFNGSASLLRYDTPSDDNYDDRDEQLIIAGTEWTKRISNNLLMRFETGLQFTHLVFLKSERSSLNNWNRIIRFSPGFDWHNTSFELHPRCEVLANYTVYDFELLGSATKSYSFRQMSYRDSIVFRLYDNWTVETRIFGRVFERGMLSWSEFSEMPIVQSNEQFLKMLMFAPISSGLRTGIGARYYTLSQNAVSTSFSGMTSSPNAHMQMYGPELSINALFADGSSLTMQGWYEWQYNGDTLFRKQVNLLLQASLHL